LLSEARASVSTLTRAASTDQHKNQYEGAGDNEERHFENERLKFVVHGWSSNRILVGGEIDDHVAKARLQESGATVSQSGGTIQPVARCKIRAHRSVL
jgi:hypothetical protein